MICLNVHSLFPTGVDVRKDDLLWSRIRHTLREPFAEFFGVFILILFGNGSVAQVVLSKGERGSYQSITWGWGYVHLPLEPLYTQTLTTA